MAPQPPDASRLEDARLTLSGRASASAARNRPRGALALACVLLLASGVYAAWAGAQLVSARAAAERERALTDRVLRLAADIEAVRSAERSGAPTELDAATRPMPDILERIIRYGSSFGLEVGLPERSDDIERDGGLREFRYTYTLRDADLSALFGWLDASLRGIPGLEVFGFQLRNERDRWWLSVTFTRLEREG